MQTKNVESSPQKDCNYYFVSALRAFNVLTSIGLLKRKKEKKKEKQSGKN